MIREKTPKPKKFRQNHNVTKHVYPRSLGRSVARFLMEQEQIPQKNKHKTKTGAYKPSVFSVYWREILFIQPKQPVNRPMKGRKIRKVSGGVNG